MWTLIVVTTVYVRGAAMDAAHFTFSPPMSQERCNTLRDWTNKQYKDNGVFASCYQIEDVKKK